MIWTTLVLNHSWIYSVLQRAVELLQASPHTDKLSFALRGYGRALR